MKNIKYALSVPSSKLKSFILMLVIISVLGCSEKAAIAQTSSSVLYVPLIGITSVPSPLALPNGSGDVIYNYAIKNFLKELPLTNVQVVDNKCSPIKFLNGDDNNDGKLDYNETWRYACTVKVSQTTQSVATATGMINGITATHKAYAMVVVGSKKLPPLVSIVNITKVAYPLSLPSQGGNITFTYRVNNPGEAPLSDVNVVDDKCSNMSGKLGDINGNNLLDPNEVWIYTCTMNLKQTTTNTVTVTAFANGLKATDSYTITVKVKNPSIFPDVGVGPSATPNFKIILWEIFSGILAVLIIIFVFLNFRKKT